MSSLRYTSTRSRNVELLHTKVPIFVENKYFSSKTVTILQSILVYLIISSQRPPFWGQVFLCFSPTLFLSDINLSEYQQASSLNVKVLKHEGVW